MNKAAHLGLLLLAFLPAPSPAQDPGSSEVVVTGTRRERDDFDATRPAVGLRRTADFAVMFVNVTGDTRDPDRRHEEILATVRSAIELAQRSGIELSTGEFIVEPLTLANYRDLAMTNDNRPDTNRVTILVKTRLGTGVDGASALERIEHFVHAVPVTGRAEVRPSGDLTLSVVAPDQYRAQILDLVAADSRATAARFGPNYAVEARGLDRPVEWMRASLTEVFLYVPYNMVVRPAAGPAAEPPR